MTPAYVGSSRSVYFERLRFDSNKKKNNKCVFVWCCLSHYGINYKFLVWKVLLMGMYIIENILEMEENIQRSHVALQEKRKHFQLLGCRWRELLQSHKIISERYSPQSIKVIFIFIVFPVSKHRLQKRTFLSSIIKTHMFLFPLCFFFFMFLFSIIGYIISTCLF